MGGQTLQKMNDHWKDIPGWEGLYEASDLGRIRSVDRYVGGPHGPRLMKGRILKETNASAYATVKLSRTGQRPICFNVHTIILSTFVGPAPEGLECCHGPEGSTVNALRNLRWDTRSANAMDRHRDGTMNSARGEDNPAARLTEADVRMIRALAPVNTQRELGIYFGVSKNTIADIIHNRAWAHV